LGLLACMVEVPLAGTLGWVLPGMHDG